MDPMIEDSGLFRCDGGGRPQNYSGQVSDFNKGHSGIKLGPYSSGGSPICGIVIIILVILGLLLNFIFHLELWMIVVILIIIFIVGIVASMILS